MRTRRIGRAQVAFLLVLLVAVAQVVWWIYDQAGYSRERQRELLAAYEAERATAEELFVAGGADFSALQAELDQRFPHLEVTESGVRIRPEALAELERERRSHVNQYRWEGAFFLAVLLAGVWVIRRALLQERELRLRQENFLAAVSHELKSPIASLRLAGDTLRRPQLSGERRQQLLDRNHRDLDRLEELVVKLLDTSRVEAGRVELAPADVELLPLVQRLVEDLETGTRGMLVGDSDRKLRVNVDCPEGLIVRADAVALETILRNLLTNAVTAVSGVEEPEISVSVSRSANSVSSVSSGSATEEITLEVRDNGVGFEPVEAERLFEKFYRPGSELQRSTKGTGLGLYLVKRFAELEGGSVTASSPGPNEGAVFRVVLRRERRSRRRGRSGEESE